MPTKEEKDPDRLLVDAARSGEIIYIRAALNAGADINVYYFSRTPLMRDATPKHVGSLGDWQSRLVSDLLNP